MKKVVKIVGYAIGAALLGVVLFFVVMWCVEWTPATVENKIEHPAPPELITKDTLKIVSWNIGYAGLGDDMDFFYDGGSSVRTSKQRTEENLLQIIAFLKDNNDADFILLQEVDFDSKRSYNTNQYDSICAALPDMKGYTAYNYVSSFVPIPLSEPIGAVKSGLVLLSRCAPYSVERLSYPSGFPFPVRLFNLKRCLLSASFDLSGTSQRLYINNTHNTAYDAGGMVSSELKFINDYLADKPLSFTAGDWNSTPVGYEQSDAERNNAFFSPYEIKKEDFSDDLTFTYSALTPTVRYGYEPYNRVTTTQSVIDFGLCRADIKPIEVETVDLGFKNSDHNPVIFRVVLNK